LAPDEVKQDFKGFMKSEILIVLQAVLFEKMYKKVLQT